MPSPSPINSQSRRWAGVACKRRGYQTRGADIRRPSTRWTVTSSSVTTTSIARGSVSTAKVLIPCLQEVSTPILHDLLDLAQLMCSETLRICESNRFDPELGHLPLSANMHVWWLTTLV